MSAGLVPEPESEPEPEPEPETSHLVGSEITGTGRLVGALLFSSNRRDAKTSKRSGAGTGAGTGSTPGTVSL